MKTKTGMPFEIQGDALWREGLGTSCVERQKQNHILDRKSEQKFN